MGTSFRPTIFKNMGGMSRVRVTPVHLAKKGKLPHYTICDIRVAVPPQRQLSYHHLKLIARLEQDWGSALSSLNCSTGDFRQALHEGRVPLGHIWAEVYCLCLDKVTVALGYGHVLFEEYFRNVKENDCYVEYKVRLFYSEPFPEEFGGLEYMVTGYLNAAIQGYWFPIERRLSEFVRYRSAPLFSKEVPVYPRARPRRLSSPLARGYSPIINRGR